MTVHKPDNLNFEKETITFTDIFLILVRSWKIILIAPTILCILTIIHVQFFTKPVYVSSAKIMSSSGVAPSQMAGLASQFGFSMPIGESGPKWSYVEVIKSRTLAKKMLKRKFDTNEFGSQKSLLQILTFGNEETKIGLDTLEILGVDNLIAMIDFSEDARTGVYTVSMSASEPKFASEITAALIEELDAHLRAYNKAKTSETRQFIDERIIEINKELEIAEEALRDFAKSNRRLENSPLLLLEQQRLSREVSVLTDVFTVLKQKLETTKIEELKESDYVLVLDSPEAPLRHSKPNKRHMVILSGFLGIGLGIVFGYVREYGINIDNEEKEKIGNAKSLVIQDITAIYHALRRFRKAITPFKLK